MAFGDLGPSYLPTSHISSEIEQPTDAKSLMAPYTGDPRQMFQFLMDPQNQEHMKNFGVHFNPDTIRESPFFSQHFMNQHPQVGGRLSGAMAGAMSVPDAPMVSGAGSGISRALQGAFGGPELLKGYQARQLQGPMQQMGMQIPPMEFQRKQQLLSSWQQMMGSSEDARKQYESEMEREHRTGEGLKQQLGDQKNQQEIDKISATKPIMSPYGVTSYKQGQPAQPGLPSTNPALQGKPAVPGSWQTEPWSKAAPNAPYYPGKPAPGSGRQGKPSGATGAQRSALDAWKDSAYNGVVQDFQNRYKINLRGQGTDTPQLTPAQEAEMNKSFGDIEAAYRQRLMDLGDQPRESISFSGHGQAQKGAPPLQPPPSAQQLGGPANPGYGQGQPGIPQGMDPNVWGGMTDDEKASWNQFYPGGPQ